MCFKAMSISRDRLLLPGFFAGPEIWMLEIRAPEI